MVRVGLFGAFEGVDALVAAVLRAELAARLPAAELRVYTPTGGLTLVGQTERVEWIDQALGTPGSIRQEELAATLDAVVIAGTVDCHPDRRSPEWFLVEGLGPFEVEVPVAWFGVAPIGEVASLRVALEHRSAVSVCDRTAGDRLADVGVAAQVVPHPALALPRLAAAAQTPAVVERLRAASALPPGDYVALDDDVAVDVPDGARLPAVGAPPRWSPLARAAAIAQAAVYVGGSPTACAMASAYGRPSVWTGPTEHTPAFAIAVGDGGSIGGAIDRARAQRPGESAIAEQLAELDAALDELAKLLDASVPADGRTERVLRIRLREEERVAARREQELADYNAALNNEIVSVGPRYTALWRKIHAGDRHYNWHRIRADRAESDVDKLWNLHEHRVTTRMKRAIRSTKVGDAAARALGAGPVVPPPSSDLGPEGPDADAPA
jgi:hypothetical protein